MPFVNIKILEDGVTREQKHELVSGVTELLVTVLNKNPDSCHVVIDEINFENWGYSGKLVADLRGKR